MAEIFGIAGGGGLVAQFYDENLLGEIIVRIGSVTLCKESHCCHANSFSPAFETRGQFKPIMRPGLGGNFAMKSQPEENMARLFESLTLGNAVFWKTTTLTSELVS